MTDKSGDKPKMTQEEMEAALQTALEEAAKAKKEAADAIALAELKDKEARQHQKRADRATRLLPSMNSGNTTEPPKDEDPATKRIRELEVAAASSERERLIMSELMKRGLTEADLEDLSVSIEDIQSPVELTLALNNLQMTRQLQTVEAQLKDKKPAGAETPPPSPAGGSGGKIDTGGVGTGERVAPQLVDDAYKQSREMGRTESAQMLRLMAIHNDPKKVLGAGELTEE